MMSSPSGSPARRPVGAPAAGEAGAALVLTDVSKVYDVAGRGRSALLAAADHLTLIVPRGEVYGLVGPNGAGKTTTLKMICGLLAPTSGRVLVHGIDVERSPEAAQALIGYLADFFGVYDELKVWEYLDHFAHAYRLPEASIPARIAEVVRILELEDKHDAFIGGLSRGMKQRLGIGRAILHDPPVLVLDEPAVGLDPRSRVHFKALVKSFNAQGKTIFVTSHLLSDLEEMCSSVAILERGRVLRAGPIARVVQAAGEGRRVRIKVTSPAFPLTGWLASQPWVTGVTGDGDGVVFQFAGGDTELAELVRALVLEGAGVYSVQELRESLEGVVSRLSGRDAS
jgi:ABC-2 type transport system ATP-binding protein